MVWWAVFFLVNYWKEILQYPEAETPVNWPGTAGMDAAGPQLFPMFPYEIIRIVNNFSPHYYATTNYPDSICITTLPLTDLRVIF
jgi:hypothetical protein